MNKYLKVFVIETYSPTGSEAAWAGYDANGNEAIVYSALGASVNHAVRYPSRGAAENAILTNAIFSTTSDSWEIKEVYLPIDQAVPQNVEP